MSVAAVALETLREHCSPEQRASLDATQTFAAIGASGKRYIIFVAGDNVTVSFENKRQDVYGGALMGSNTWTATVRGRFHHLPAADCALLAKLSIEAHEEHWKAMAYMCGNVYVEDRGEQELVAEAAYQRALAEQQRLNQLAQAGQLPVGHIWHTYNRTYQWNGQAWVQIA